MMVALNVIWIIALFVSATGLSLGQGYKFVHWQSGRVFGKPV